jgi:RNA polymerase sigma-70 factor (ECF subfamily)
VKATVAEGERTGLDFEGFFHAEYEQLLRTMYLLCRDLEEARDLSQEAMARALERWDRVRRAESPRAYVYAIAFNLRRSALRRAAVALRHRADPARGPEPDRIAEEREELRRLLRSLPRTQLEALLLVAWVGLSSEEAARVLGIDPASVRGRVHRARVTLRAKVEAEDGG